MNTSTSTRHSGASGQAKRQALKIAVLYAIAGSLWIAITDSAVFDLVTDRDEIRFLSNFKGWLYIALTAVLIYVLARRAMQAQERLTQEAEQNEAQFRSYIELSPLAVFIIDGEGRCVECNPAALDLQGYDRNELQEMTIADSVIPEDRELALQQFATLQKESRITAEIRLRRKDGGTVRAMLHAVRLANDRFLAYLHDLSDQLRAFDAVRQSEQKFRLLFESMRDAYVKVDMSGRITEYNQVYRQMLGYDEAEIATLTYLDITPEKWHAFEQKIIGAQVLPRGYSEIYEKEYRRKDGTVFPVELRTGLIRDSAGQPLSMWAIVRDITDRKEVERNLRESEATARALLDIPTAAAFMIDRSGIMLDMNETLLRRFGKTRDEVLGRAVWDLLPPAVAETRRVFFARILAEKQQIRYEVERDGRWYDAIISPLLDEQGEVIKVVVVGFDITDRKRMEESILRSQAELATAQGLAKVGSWQLWIQGEQEVWSGSDELYRICGYAAGMPLTRELVVSTIHPDDREQVLKRWAAAAGGGLPQVSTHRLSIGGRDVWVRATVECRVNDQEILREARGTIQDITEQRKVEQALRDSEERYRMLFEVESDAIFVLDRVKGTFIEANSAAQALYGYSRDELLRMRAADISAEPEKTLRAVASAEPKIPFRLHRKKDGTVFPVEIAEAPFEYRGTRMIVAAIRDITEQKGSEERLRRYARRLLGMEEDMRKKLAAELHDKIGPDLTALGMNLSMLVGELSDESRKKVDHRLADVQIMLGDIGRSIREMMADLRPPVLDDYGLPAALRWYSELFSKRTAIATTLDVDDAFPRLAPEREMTLFRITQEALNNAAKHAGTMHAIVTLQRNDGRVRLLIFDDGRGFHPSSVASSASGTGWGLTIMRERAEAAGGSFRLQSSPGKGTVISVELPEENQYASQDLDR
ncbi:MAG: PAS domain S-box protein [Nitrospiraceae bacterium]|nr:PAS domain S-box protein [Nitrospiraceae bacterium]